MNEKLKVKFLFKKKQFTVSLQQKDYQNLPQPVLLSLLIQQHYEIKSDVKEEIFQSIIEYFVHETIPDIHKENIDEYDLICKELQLQNILEIIQQKRELFNNISKIISSISDKSMTDNSSAEHSISQILDDVIKYYSTELMNLPIQSLYNIFNSNDCNFMSHERLYDLILNHFENNKKYEIFMLLQFVDGSKIPEQKLINSIRDESLHFGFKPFFDISSLFKKIHELENENRKLKNGHGKKQNDEQKNDLGNKKYDEQKNDSGNEKDDEQKNDSGNEKDDEQKNDSGNEKDDEQKNDSDNKKDDEQKNDSDNEKDDEQNKESIDINNSSKNPNQNAIKIDDTFAYINEKNEIYDEGINYKLDHSNHTAEIFFTRSLVYDIYVPRSIIFKSTEYVITKIGKTDICLHHVKSITFSNDSRIKCIDFDNFRCFIKIRVSIPSQLEKISFGKSTSVSVYITIPSNCQNFKWSENILLGKSNVNSDDFDTIVYVHPDTEQVIIPSYIKHINPGCFLNNQKLQKIEFLPDSKIISVGNYQFFYRSLTIVNPPNSLIFKNEVFLYNRWKNIVIPPNNQNFKWSENILFSKSNVNSDNFDTLVCANRNIVSANIPSNIKYMCLFCFTDCRKLQNVVFSNDSQLCSIERNAFINTSIGTITIPPHVTEIGDLAFYGCSTLRSVVFSDNSELRSIGRNAFHNTSIEAITIPPHVTEIGDDAFEGCSKLRSVVFYNNSELRSIGKRAFQRTSIETIIIPPRVIEIGEGVLYNCLKLRSIVFPSNSELRSIGHDLINYSIKPGKTAIIQYSENDSEILFYPPKNVTQVIVSSNIKHIYSDCFAHIKNLYSIVFPNNSKLYSIGRNAFMFCSITSITIPSHVKEIFDYAFSHSNLHCINFSDDSELRSIGKFAFRSTSIETITIPPHVTEIGDGAFKNCSKLQKVVIPYNSELRSIGYNVFKSTNIKNIRIPSHITTIKCIFDVDYNKSCNFEICGISTIFSIGKNIFEGSYSTFQIFPSPDDGSYEWFDEKILLGKTNENDDDYDILVYANPDIEQVTIPSSIKYIYHRCFDYCKELKEVEFQPDSKLISIGEYAFRSTSIEKITIPSHVTEIKEGAFQNCSKLLIVFYPDDSELRSIGKCAFCNTKIETIVIPRNVSTIGKSAFGGCNKIKNIIFSKGSKLNSIDKSAFENISEYNNNYHLRNKIMVPQKNPRLKLCEDGTLYGKSDENLDDFDTIIVGNKYGPKVSIPSNIKYIYPYSFNYGTQIKEVEFLPDSKLISIGEYAFCYNKIKSITIPPHVIEIGSSFSFEKVIFEGGSKLSLCEQWHSIKSITILSDMRPDIIRLIKIGSQLNEIIVPPENKRYKSLGDLVLYKSKEDSDDFDALLSAIETSCLATPSNIKYIYPYCFFKSNLQKIEFPDNSELLSIEEHAFSSTSIEMITIPPHVTKIGEYAFEKCSKLRHVNFSNDSQLRSIGKYAFSYTPIETITIPLHVIEIDEQAFEHCSKLRHVYFSNDSELRSIRGSAFVCTSIETITIPPHVTEIGNGAFSSCSRLRNVVFSDNSELRSIRGGAFNSTSIESITIPPHVTEIGENAFSSCSRLRSVVFPSNSELRSIGENAFQRTSIETIIIPPHVFEIGEGAFPSNTIITRL